MHANTISQICAVAILMLILVAPASTIVSLTEIANAQKLATFPPPIMYKLKDIPSYVIVIPLLLLANTILNMQKEIFLWE